MSELPLASVEKLMRNAGAERVSMDALVGSSHLLKSIPSPGKEILPTTSTFRFMSLPS